MSYAYYVDVRPSNFVNIQDIALLASKYMKSVSIQDPITAQFDVRPSGFINIQDISLVASFFMEPAPNPPAKALAGPVSETPVFDGIGHAVVGLRNVPVRVRRGEPVSFDLAVEEAINLAALQFDLVFDRPGFEVEHVTLAELFQADGHSAFLVGPKESENGMRISYGAAILGREEGVTGAGRLATIEMTSDVSGPFRIHLDNVLATDALGNLIPVQVKAPSVVPGEYFLSQNYPNPFNPRTTLRFGIPTEGDAESQMVRATLQIYNVRGQLVRSLVDEDRVPGMYLATWDGMDSAGTPVASGVYFCFFRAGQFRAVNRMVLLK